MKDTDCAAFLRWALPRLRMRWPGFRKVRRQVCKRIGRRVRELGLESLAEYRKRLEAEPAEWGVLDGYCRITISRFCRDRPVFEVIAGDILPRLAERASARRRPVRCWCAGCASGEEVYSLKIIWDREVQPRFPGVGLEIIGTDADPIMLQRAERGCYARGSLKDMPERWLARAFDRANAHFRIRPGFRRGVRFKLQDIREEMPSGPFDLLLCRNLAFTYFDPPLQETILHRLAERLRPAGYLVIGRRETLPAGEERFRPLPACPEIYGATSAPSTKSVCSVPDHHRKQRGRCP